MPRHGARLSTALLAAVLALALALPACGGDAYSGTWQSIDEYSARDENGNTTVYRARLEIEKADDGWLVTDSLGNSREVEEVDGQLVRTDSARSDALELRDDQLVLMGADGGVLMRFEKQ